MTIREYEYLTIMRLSIAKYFEVKDVTLPDIFLKIGHIAEAAGQSYHSIPSFLTGGEW
jgi:hypothetical protein